MKKMSLMLLALLPVIGYARQYPCTINLNTDTVKARMAFLVYQIGDEYHADSQLVKNGRASFKISIPYTVHAQLSLDRRGYGYENGNRPDLLRFYLEKGVINIKTRSRIADAVITGSKINTEMMEYNRMIAGPMKELEDANYHWMTSTPEYRADTSNWGRFYSINRQSMKKLLTLQEQWVRSHPDTYVSLEALSTIAGGDINVAKVQPLFESLSEELRNSVDGKELGNRITAASKTGIGAMAPEFTQNDVNDKPVKLSDFRGKYVLIDFWASWCGPCRQENPNYVKVYNQYKDRNFTMLGVSLDQPGKKDAWLEAIKKDGLEWTNVSDLKYWKNEVAKMYDITAVPANYLIDPDGKIIAKNLRGEDLQKKLKELFGE